MDTASGDQHKSKPDGITGVCGRPLWESWGVPRSGDREPDASPCRQPARPTDGQPHFPSPNSEAGPHGRWTSDEGPSSAPWAGHGQGVCLASAHPSLPVSLLLSNGFPLGRMCPQVALGPRFSGIHLQGGCTDRFLCQFLVWPKSYGRTLSGLLRSWANPSANRLRL